MVREKTGKISFIDLIEKLNQWFSAELWRTTRSLFKKYDDSEDAISGVDITDYLAPGTMRLSAMQSIVQLIFKIDNDMGKDAVFIGVERKGFVFAGALLDEFGESEIALKRSRLVKEKDVKGKLVVIIDDASKTGTKIIDEAKRFKKYGANNIIAIVAIATKAAVENIKKQLKDKNVAVFSHIICADEEEYGELYPAFYHIVSSSIIPVTGEPKAEIEFTTINLDIIVKALCNLDRGKYVSIDSIENSYPVRGTIDYYDYAQEHGTDDFRRIGDKTGFFIKLDQAKIRLYFDFDGQVRAKLCPIVYLEIPENVDCRNLKKCQKAMDLTGEPVMCPKCIEDMIGDILLDIMKKDLDKKASSLHLKYKFKKL